MAGWPTLKRKLSGKKKKSEAEVPMQAASYAGRHPGRDFLVLVSGPSIRSHEQAVTDFIAREKPIVLGCNRLPAAFAPDYHVYVNRKRFESYASLLTPGAKLILSPYFLEKQIRGAIGKQPYELLMYRNIYPGTNGSLEVRDSAIYAEGATVGPLACGVAWTMGGRNLYIAGMDGYSKSEQTHHYDEPDNKEREDLLAQERATKGLLRDLSQLFEGGGGRLRILTPTAYDAHYEAGLL